MLGKAIEPAPFKKNSFYTPVQPTTRPYLLPEIVSLPMTDLFPDMPEAPYVYGGDVSIVREMTEKALESVDMSMIKPSDSVNIICSEHGFNIMGGFAYAEMLKTIKDVVEERTGCGHIRLRSASGNMNVEGVSTLFDFGLIEYFEGKAEAFIPFDEGLYLDTEIGKIGVVKAPFDADWFIHTSYSDPREIYFNRNINRVYKAFAMGYAKAETRSAFHLTFGPRSSNIIPFAIFNALSDKHAFTVDMDLTPAGITDVTADNDIERLNKKAMIKILKNFGALFCLANKMENIIAIQDCARWVWYNHCGGMVFGVLLKAHRDLFDLDVVPRISEGINSTKLKSIVVNNTTMGGWGRLPIDYPIFIADQVTAAGQDSDLIVHSTICDGLQDAVERAKEVTGTDRIMVFDGSFGYMNVSRSMAEHLLENAPAAIKEAEELMPKWLKQRGIDPSELEM